jgi:UDP-N-acetyl-2-amino-2-deoxyglucuronate dehydrogenase
MKSTHGMCLIMVKKVIIFGGGRIAERHIQVLTQNHSENYKIVACIEQCSHRRDYLKEKYNVSIFHDLSALSSKENIDLTVICTESGNHFNSFSACKYLNCDFLIEKPVTLRLDHAHELEEWAKGNARNVFVVKQNRYNLAVETAKNWIDSGYIGDLYHVSTKVFWCRDKDYYGAAKWRGTWANDGGVISNQASHHVDLLQYLCSTAPESVYSKMYGHSRLTEAEDTMLAILEFDNGISASLEATTCARPANISAEITLLGSAGYVKISGFACNKIEDYSLMENDAIKPGLTITEEPKDVYGFGHTKLYGDLTRFYSDKPNQVVDISEGIKSLELIHLMYMSAENRRPMNVSELGDGFALLGRGGIHD